MFFEELSLFLQEEILFKISPDDLLTLCSTEIEYIQINFCQNQDFWQRYFLARNRTPPEKISIPQYYYEEYYYFDLVENYLNYLNPDIGGNIIFTDFEKFKPDLFQKLNLEDRDQQIISNFFDILGTSGKFKFTNLTFIQTYEKNHFNLLFDIVDLEYDSVFYKFIDFSREQAKLLFGRMLAENMIPLDFESREPVEL